MLNIDKISKKYLILHLSPLFLYVTKVLDVLTFAYLVQSFGTKLVTLSFQGVLRKRLYIHISKDSFWNVNFKKNLTFNRKPFI